MQLKGCVISQRGKANYNPTTYLLFYVLENMNQCAKSYILNNAGHAIPHELCHGVNSTSELEEMRHPFPSYVCFIKIREYFLVKYFLLDI